MLVVRAAAKFSLQETEADFCNRELEGKLTGKCRVFGIRYLLLCSDSKME